MSPTPSNEVILEMVKNIKEESLPNLHRKIDTFITSIDAIQDDVDGLKNYRAESKGEIRAIKMVGTILAGLFAIVGTIFGIHKG